MISTSSILSLSITEALSRSIEETLRDLVGERVKEALFNCLEEQGVRRDEIPESLTKFEVFLEQRLGKAGPVIQKQIAKRLYSKLGLELVEVPRLGLSDYVDIALRRINYASTTKHSSLLYVR